MSISPAQMTLQVDSAGGPALRVRSTRASVPAAAQPVETIVESTAAVPTESSGPQLSTDMRVDDQHQIYYETVDDRTGNVVCEIPPEVIRKLSENLKVSLEALVSGHSVDVKS